MLSRTGERAVTGHTRVATALPAELVNKLQGYYLPWIREALTTADDDLIWRRPNDGVNSIGNLLLHMEGNIRQWMIHGLGGEDDRRDRDAEFAADDGADKWTLYNALEATVNQACEVMLQPRSDEDWLRPVVIQSFDTTPLNACIHVVEHFSYHTGQIVTMVRSASGADLHFYNL